MPFVRPSLGVPNRVDPPRCTCRVPMKVGEGQVLRVLSLSSGLTHGMGAHGVVSSCLPPGWRGVEVIATRCGTRVVVVSSGVAFVLCSAFCHGLGGGGNMPEGQDAFVLRSPVGTDLNGRRASRNDNLLSIHCPWRLCSAFAWGGVDLLLRCLQPATRPISVILEVRTSFTTCFRRGVPQKLPNGCHMLPGVGPWAF